MSGFLIGAGFLAVAIGIIVLVVSAIRRKRLKPWVITTGVGLIVLIIGAATAPSPERGITVVTKPTPTPIESPEDFKTSAKTDLSYDELARNTESYIGQRVYYRGKVVQVVEQGGDKAVLRVNVTEKEYGWWDDTVWVNYKGPRVLEDDIVKFWGIIEGRRKYRAVLGNEVVIPEITAKYLEIEQK